MTDINRKEEYIRIMESLGRLLALDKAVRTQLNKPTSPTNDKDREQTATPEPR